MHSRGFTFVEMLVVMTISAILIAVAVPSFQWTIARNRVSDATNQLLGHLEYARMEASRRGNAVSLCRTTNPDAPVALLVCNNAATAAVDGNDWAAGWIVFEKVPPITMPGFDQAVDQLVFRQQAMVGVATSGARVMIHSDSPGGLVTYQPRGAGGIVGGGQMFAIDYGGVLTPISANRAITTIALTNAARCIPITALGSMRVARTLAGVCQ
jgi:prepilin-type N-terminal cleavage/methylation domain-containing protein